MESGQLNLAEYPKVELHRHLEGSLRFSTLLELAKSHGLELPTNKAELREHFLVTQPMKDLAAVLNKFWMTQSVLNSEEILTRITFEAIEDAANEGVKILELRYAPTFIRKNHDDLTFEQIHQAIVKGVRLAQTLPISVGLICILQRVLPQIELERVVRFAIENKDTFVGVDLADDEDVCPARNFAGCFEKIRQAGLPITIHAGESNSVTSPKNVQDAIEILGARRIGHGLQIINDKNVIDVVRSRHIPLEICVHSNWLTNAIADINSHPILKLIQAGVLVTINSDDPGIFGTNLTNDYKLLRDQYGFSKTDFDRANDIAAAASFIALSKKQKYWPRPIHN